MALAKNKPERDLAADIVTFRTELEQFIDNQVEVLRRAHPGVPAPVLKRDLTKGSGCHCLVCLNILEKINA